MAMALEGIRVLDWTQFQQGPVATMLLGDLGADVIKIEDRVTGDRGRGVMRVGGSNVAESLSQRNPYFEIGNRNKRSITLDLKKQKGKEIVYKLAGKADVFVHNFRPDTVERLGLDYETLSKHNRRLIYAQGSGWGSKGPDKDTPGFDPAALARSGFWTLLTEPGRDPQYPQGGIADQMGAMTMAFGVLAALVYRERTGVGQQVDASILGGMSFLVAYPLTFYTMCGFPPLFVYRNSPWNPLYNQYKCSDGRWIALVLVPPDQYWPALCKAMGLQELEKDSRFDSLDARQNNSRELIGILDERFATRSSQEWTRILRQHGLVFSTINTVEEFASDPQAIANDYVTEFDHPVWGRIKVAGFPVGYDETPCSIKREAPEFGQHTEEVLRDILGYTWEEISRLKDEEII
jgi:crotonobetainyl-CoA:carnitine CoA-transferase CaiB-like acyl-CoA transferase